MNPSEKEWSLIRGCPDPGCGVHDWTFKVLCILARKTEHDHVLLSTARRFFGRYAKRPVQDSEITSQIPNVRRYIHADGVRGRGGVSLAAPLRLSSKWPSPDLARIEDIVRLGPFLRELPGLSRHDVAGDRLRTAAILETLFPGNPLLSCGADFHAFKTMRRSEWLAPERLQFIVPSPMTKERGGNKKGKESPRCLDNTGPRKFLVVEFDFKASEERLVQRPDISGVVGRLAASGITSLDMCAALLWHLSKFKHLAMVVHSGGKSLHGWFACAGESEENLRSFMQEAVRLGADKATWNPCQAVRMPGGTRFPQRVQQSVYYFNPL